MSYSVNIGEKRGSSLIVDVDFKILYTLSCTLDIPNHGFNQKYVAILCHVTLQFTSAQVISANNNGVILNVSNIYVTRSAKIRHVRTW